MHVTLGAVLSHHENQQHAISAAGRTDGHDSAEVVMRAHVVRLHKSPYPHA